MTNDSQRAQSPNCHINSEETQISLACIFFEDLLTWKPCKPSPFEKYSETNNKEEMGIFPQSFRNRMAQDASIQHLKNSQKNSLKGKLTSSGFFSRIFKIAVAR